MLVVVLEADVLLKMFFAASHYSHDLALECSKVILFYHDGDSNERKLFLLMNSNSSDL